ncbi:MAG TPA: hypothetical protein ENN73_01305, partial [Firmicutes bacterium]|nr:hypothetical protein [Bacillota bacterium]
MNRVFFIGIDAGDFKYIEPLVKRNKLPNFRKLIQSGAWCVLESTNPPLTPVAWTTLLSGLGKSEHKVFSWTKFSDDLKEITPINANDIKIPRVWDILNVYGIKSVVMNLPLTYPAYPINGVMVSGFDAEAYDDRATAMTEPLKNEFKEKYPDYSIMVEYKNIYQGLEIFKKLWKEDCRKKTEAFIYLMNKTSAQFGILVYMIVDHLNHYIPYGLKKHRTQVEWAYSIVDQEIGRIMDEMEKTDSIIICSDHGSVFIKQNFFINKWLADNGYLRFYDDKLPDKIYRNIYNKLSMKARIFKIFGEKFGEKLFRFLFEAIPTSLKKKVVKRVRDKSVLGFSFDCIDLEN